MIWNLNSYGTLVTISGRSFSGSEKFTKTQCMLGWGSVVHHGGGGPAWQTQGLKGNQTPEPEDKQKFKPFSDMFCKMTMTLMTSHMLPCCCNRKLHTV